MKHEKRQSTLSGWLDGHKGLLRKIVRAYAFTAPDQEDLYQEIAVQLWHSIPSFRGDSKVSTWVYRVALYEAMAWSRRERRHRDRVEPLADPDAGPGSASAKGAAAPDDRVTWLYERIARLAPIDRSLMLMLLEGFSYQEMATTLGVSPSNVGVRIHRIKRRMAALSRAE